MHPRGGVIVALYYFMSLARRMPSALYSTLDVQLSIEFEVVSIERPSL
jgi:hypothetical protein